MSSPKAVRKSSSKYRDISPKKTRKASTSRSPSRARRSSPPKSPRKRSPIRKSPARRSPGRPRNDVRKQSPSRTIKSKNVSPVRSVEKKASPTRPTEKKEVKKSPKKVLKIQVERGDSDLGNYNPPKSRRSEFSSVDFTSNFKQIETSVGEKLNGFQATLKERFGFGDVKKPTELLPRRSSRLQELTSSEKGSSVSSSKKADTDEEFSEDDGFYLRKSSSRKLITPLPDLSFSKLLRGNKEFGGLIGCIILILLIPAVVFYIIAACTGSCNIRNTPDVTPYKNSSTWYSNISLLIICLHFVIQAMISLIPIGSRIKVQNYELRGNAIVSLLIPLVAVVLDFFHVISLKILIVEYFRLAIISYAIGVLAAIGAYWKASKGYGENDNNYGNTGVKIYDFYLGCQLHPVLFKKISLKLWFRRVSIISAVILTVAIFVQGLHRPNILQLSQNITGVDQIMRVTPALYKNWTLFTICCLQLVYFLDLLVSESNMITTFSWQSEGFGYLLAVSSSLYPFFAVAISKNVLEQNIQVSWKVLVGCIALYFIGFLIYKLSNKIKHDFRMNPIGAKNIKYETMPTLNGKKLLLSNLWGILRHPNYLGDILLHAALVIPAAITGPSVTVAVAILTCLILLHRVSRDNTRCSKRYGAAWQRYRARVRSAIIPKIY